MNNENTVNNNYNNDLHSVDTNDKANLEKVVEVSEYAGQLPDWDLTPPVVVVRRVKRVI